MFHPAWGYFAKTYRPVQVPIEREGKQPGALALVTLTSEARRGGIRITFVQPQVDRRQSERVAEAIGGSVVVVDPMALNQDNLCKVARQFSEALVL